jgi:hypothetical protein
VKKYLLPVLQVTNNTHYAQAFDLSSSLTVAAVEPLLIEDNIAACEGYYSENVEVNNEVEGGSGAYRLSAGDICFYRVTLDTPLTLIPKSLPSRRVQNLYVKMPPDCRSLQQFVLDHPTFTQRFTGVTVDEGSPGQCDVLRYGKYSPNLGRNAARRV